MAVGVLLREVVVRPIGPRDVPAGWVSGTEFGVEHTFREVDAVERVVEDVPVVLHGLGHTASGRELRQHDVQQA